MLHQRDVGREAAPTGLFDDPRQQERGDSLAGDSLRRESIEGLGRSHRRSPHAGISSAAEIGLAMQIPLRSCRPFQLAFSIAAACVALSTRRGAGLPLRPAVERRELVAAEHHHGNTDRFEVLERQR